jgi:putative ABC transport system permease protein
MTLLLGAWTIGLILALLALGVYVSFRVFNFPDITADGSITLGASVAAILVVSGVNPFVATLVAAAAGMVAGSVTGTLYAKLGIQKLLAGILVMTALYSVNLHVMGKSNVPLLSEETLATLAGELGVRLAGAETLTVGGWEVRTHDASVLLAALLLTSAVAALIYVFFRTNLGTAMRATGDNHQMIRANGVNDGNMVVMGLAVSNGLIALSGALLAQYQGFADVQMGIGMVVWGLASVIIGEALVRSRRLGITILGAVMGSVLFRLMVAIALRWGLDPNDLKLITALFVLGALILPGALARLQTVKVRPEGA